jgi:uncharacterized protein
MVLKEDKVSIIGRSLKDIEKYGEKGCIDLGKVVMSSGEKPVLGRKVVMDVTKSHVVLVCGKRGGGKCLHGDTEILLDDGSLKKISELNENSNEIISLNEDYKLEKARKTEFFKRKVNKLLELTLRTGKKIKLTPEHPLLTIEGWKPAEEISKGGRIAVPRKLTVFGKEFLTEAKIKLLAYLLAEGHIKRRAVYFSNEDELLINDFKKAVKEFDSRLTVNKSSKNNFRVVNTALSSLIVNSKNGIKNISKIKKSVLKNFLRSWLIELKIYDKDSYSKFIPEIIFKLPKPKIALFLNRFFSCDGTIYFDSNTASWRVSVSSVSSKLISQLQHLLLRFEIISVLREKTNKLNEKEFHSFELELKGLNVEKFLLEIGFFGVKELKQKQAIQFISGIERNPNTDTIPKQVWDYYRPKNWAQIGRTMNYAYPKALRESIKYAPSRQKLLQIAKADENNLIQKLAESDIYWDEIKEVKELIGDFEVFDLSVPVNHNFIANDLIVHNSYSMSVIIEGFARLPIEVRRRLSVIVIDTVGIFWTLKIPNEEERKSLAEWDMEPESTNVKVMVPKGKLSFYKEKELPVDGGFALKYSELGTEEWMALFKLTWKDEEGILLTQVIESLKESLGTYYGLNDILNAIEVNDESDKKTKLGLINRFNASKSWGLFEKEGTKIKDLAKPGQITIIDVSAYRQSIGMEGTRDIIVGLIGKKLFEERMLFRKEEEAKAIKGEKIESEMPLVWMMIDEAHMFMPKDENSIALNALLEWVRVGRQPGLALLLATQRPNKLHPDCISQCDLFISHRMTAQEDIEAVSQLRPSYLQGNFDKYYQEMPKAKGYALVLDDNTERLWLIKVRQRYSWDGGKTASAFTK